LCYNNLNPEWVEPFQGSESSLCFTAGFTNKPTLIYC
jgi:hypothetical protein